METYYPVSRALSACVFEYKDLREGTETLRSEHYSLAAPFGYKDLREGTETNLYTVYRIYQTI